jgi:hypothetical protein
LVGLVALRDPHLRALAALTVLSAGAAPPARRGREPFILSWPHGINGR